MKCGGRLLKVLPSSFGPCQLAFSQTNPREVQGQHRSGITTWMWGCEGVVRVVWFQEGWWQPSLCQPTRPQGLRTVPGSFYLQVQTELNLACLSTSRIKRGFNYSAEGTNTATLYYHQLYCKSLLEQWWIFTVYRNLGRQSFFSCSSSTAKWIKLLHYSHFMCEKNIF